MGQDSIEICGYVRQISCGMFNDANEFERMHMWASTGTDRHEFGYCKDVSMFRADIPDTATVGSKYMEIRNSNICAIIEERQNSGQAWRVLFFVLHKPPQFYQLIPDGDQENARFRISHPSADESGYSNDKDEVDLHIAGVPWYIQYSRVWKVDYEEDQTVFNAQDSSLSRADARALNAIQCDPIMISSRGENDMQQTLRYNLDRINQEACPEIRLALFGLFINSNLCPVLEGSDQEVERVFEHMRQGDERDEYGADVLLNIRNLYNGLRSCAQNIGTQQMRAVKRLRGEEHRDPMAEDLWFPVRDLDVINAGPLAETPLEVFILQVYPSHIELHGPAAQGANLILDEYRDHLGRFVRMRFMDNHGKALRREADVRLNRIIDERVVQVLSNERQPLLSISMEFEFLGYTMSSLKKKKAVYVLRKEPELLGAHAIRSATGLCDPNSQRNRQLAQTPSKWGARLSLAFTVSRKALELTPNEWEIRSDVGQDPDFPNTDGCGIISRELCDRINRTLVGFSGQGPSAFQIRFGGVKGVVFAAHDSLLTQGLTQGLTRFNMRLRESQRKFDPPNQGRLDLRVVSTTADGWSSLSSGPIVKVLEDLGANTDSILRLYVAKYHELATMSKNGLDLLAQIRRCSITIPETSARNMLLKLAIRLQRDNLFPDGYRNSFLNLYLVRLAQKARAKSLFTIPIPGSYQVLGLTDDYQVLAQEEVYVRANGDTVTGQVLIYRDPIIHIGDIQKAMALTDEEVVRSLEKGADRLNALSKMDALRKLDNVIFFSQRDDPPFPNRLSGGDLDGDRFEVLTMDTKDTCWLRDIQLEHNLDYADLGRRPQWNQIQHGPNAPNPHGLPQNFDIRRLIEFIGTYIQYDCFAELEEILMCLADERPEGMRDQHVRDLAPDLSQAVDFAKSGNGVDLYEQVLQRLGAVQGQRKPDVVRGLSADAFYDTRDHYRPSVKLLGRIYQHISQLQYEIPDNIGQDTIRDGIRRIYPGLPDENSSRRVRNRLENYLRDHFNNYLTFLRNKNIEQTTETDIFLRRKLDNFPEDQLRWLNLVVEDTMDECYAQLPGGDDQKYRVLLFCAWEITLGWAYSVENQGFGQSYAFICLYALYFSEL